MFSSPEADHWVLKGAGALLARLANARHSKDLDVFLSVNDVDADGAGARDG
ncbi:nucleotidyl transferase AbiEii/AbiGii toxin family protein [Actinoplanes sp. NPDC049548]|uniref:nucleotidyl transferase AbiEii/AbiGii toxin family protein n=1 Tax=Actinoplanes sp. NPDC049548 TaxID=3155152 RepID=UPI00343827B7